MKQVRQEVYETNSSSSHSISIASWNRKTIYDTLIPDEDGVIKLTGGDYGWEGGSSRDCLDKCNYCAQDTINNQAYSDMLAEVICEHTGARLVVFDCDGYIDHQSQGTSYDAFSSKDTLKEFLFNPRSYLDIDNDNH